MPKFVFNTTDASQLADSYDLVIIGSGGTGLTAALQAHELGSKVAILEKMPKLGGNTNRASSGMNAAETQVQLDHQIVDSMDDFYDETLKGGGGLNNPAMLRYFTDHSALAIDWLAHHGINLMELTITGGMSTYRTHRPASKAPIGGFLVTELLKLIAKAGIPIFSDVKVTELAKTGDTVTGVVVSHANETRTVNAKAVILATGGFGANPEMLLKYRPDLKGYKTTNQPGATGDGIKLAEQAGAALVDMDQVQVHPTVQQDTPHTFLIGEAVRGEGAILVNKAGERFTNELDTRKNVTAKIDDLYEGGAYLIFDSKIRAQVKAIDFYDAVGLVKHGDNLADLAKEANINAENLQTTVARWNECVKAGSDVDWHRTTGMDLAIVQGPFFAIHIAPAVHYTMGGVKIDTQTHVLDQAGHPLAGLFAAGEVAGGLHGNNRIGGNSIAETVIYGRQAGQQSYKYIKSL
ncbi:MAG: flavocytochrome c [Lactobacillus sp.]